jgi:cytochrome c553
MHRTHRLAPLPSAGRLAALLCAVALGAHAQDSKPAANAAAAPGNAPQAAAKAPALDWSVPVQNKIAQCQGCHGIPGWKTAFPEVYEVPKLGGQKAEYIVAALKEYRSGERDFGTMRAIASQLTDSDMEALAKYYAEGGSKPQQRGNPQDTEKK